MLETARTLALGDNGWMSACALWNPGSSANTEYLTHERAVSGLNGKCDGPHAPWRRARGSTAPAPCRTCPSARVHPDGRRFWRGPCVQLAGGPDGSTRLVAAGRAAFQAAGSMAGTSLNRTPRASRGRMSVRYSTGFTPTSRQQPRIVYAIAARSPPVSDPAKR
jgi:hypothetical protein